MFSCLNQNSSVWNILCVDYNLLEEVKRVSESAQRMRSKVCGYSHYKLPYHLKGLRKAAASRKTKLLFLPSGMSKREKNQTRYNNRLLLVPLDFIVVDSIINYWLFILLVIYHRIPHCDIFSLFPLDIFNAFNLYASCYL